MSTHVQGEVPGRRDAIKILVGGGVAAAFGCTARELPPATTGGDISESGATFRPRLACISRPEQTEGPYFIDEKLMRADIRVDPTNGSRSPGVPLELALGVQRIAGSTCSPLVGVLVDVWHCDAAGVYSDIVDTDARFDTSGRRFLRGSLLTDTDGTVRFTTIFPGSYAGRTAHIHFKIRAGLTSKKPSEFTSQLYFDDELTARVYEHAPYQRRAAGDVTNATDFVYRRGGNRLLLDVAQHGLGYRAELGIGLLVP